MAKTGRTNSDFPILILFVLGAGLLNNLSVIVGMGLSILLPYSGANSLYLAMLSASAFGALTYGWLVRKVLLPQIPLGLMLVAAPILCVLVTFVVLHFHLNSPLVHLPTALWWIAFSFSTFALWYLNRRGRFQRSAKSKP